MLLGKVWQTEREIAESIQQALVQEFISRGKHERALSKQSSGSVMVKLTVNHQHIFPKGKSWLI